jgi:hypothetical protein
MVRSVWNSKTCLALYLGFTSLFEVIIFWGGLTETFSLSAFEPRLVVLILAEIPAFRYIHLVVCAALLTLAVSVYKMRMPIIQLYLVSEFLLAIPTLYFILFAVAADANPNHGFSRNEAIALAISFGFSCVVPWFWSLYLLRRFDIEKALADGPSAVESRDDAPA